ncbi:MAG: cytochrome b/b6 domain-containing protein [Burkholderiaceae bacterium]|jgi:cytochrome b|nr:cytochrome b/b6 domain-containing protein [Burkholderiaceae bacterium]
MVINLRHHLASAWAHVSDQWAARHQDTGPRRRVKDAPMRSFHWLFAACFTLAYLTSETEKLRMLHVTMGYTLVGLLAFRLVYGVVGPRHANIGALWRKAKGLPHWVRQTSAQLATPTSGPAINWRQGYLMVTPVATLLILALVAPIALSGYATFNELGGDWLQDALGEVHEFFGNFMLFTVLGHLAWLVVLSLLTKRNEASPMYSGTVAGAGPDLVQHNRLWLGIAVVLGVVLYVAWEWQNSPNGLIRWSALF